MQFEMAHSDNPEEIILATQRSLVDAIRGVIKDLRADKEKLGKQPGLTWEQIDFILTNMRDKTPKVIFQEQPT